MRSLLTKSENGHKTSVRLAQVGFPLPVCLGKFQTLGLSLCWAIFHLTIMVDSKRLKLDVPERPRLVLSVLHWDLHCFVAAVSHICFLPPRSLQFDRCSASIEFISTLKQISAKIQ
jgi:hypothetical protein